MGYQIIPLPDQSQVSGESHVELRTSIITHHTFQFSIQTSNFEITDTKNQISMGFMPLLPEVHPGGRHEKDDSDFSHWNHKQDAYATNHYSTILKYSLILIP